jgi:hypothetical protein
MGEYMKQLLAFLGAMTCFVLAGAASPPGTRWGKGTVALQVVIKPKAPPEELKSQADFQFAQSAWLKSAIPIDELIKKDPEAAAEALRQMKAARIDADAKSIALRESMKKATEQAIQAAGEGGSRNTIGLKAAVESVTGFFQANQVRLQEEIDKLSVNPEVNSGVLAILRDQLESVKRSKADADSFVKKVSDPTLATDVQAYNDFVKSFRQLGALIDDQIATDKLKAARYVEYYDSIGKQLAELQGSKKDPALLMLGEWADKNETGGCAVAPNKPKVYVKYRAGLMIEQRPDAVYCTVVLKAADGSGDLTISSPVGTTWFGEDHEKWNSAWVPVKGSHLPLKAGIRFVTKSPDRLNLDVLIEGMMEDQACAARPMVRK